RVRDDLDGTSVRCHVGALYMGKLQQVAESEPVTVRKHGVVACTIALPPGGALGVNLANGSRCGDDRQCVSAFCVDGRCCGVRWDSACRAGDRPQGPGSCSFVPEGTLPRDSAQCPKSDATSCGTDGMCDGHGACREYPAGTPCAGGRCEGAAVTGSKICD